MKTKNYEQITHDVRQAIEARQDHISIARLCTAYYECPKDKDGKRLGPLAGLAYRDESGRQKVSDQYLNFAKVEENHIALEYIATSLGLRISRCDCICGAPEGGKALAVLLAHFNRSRYIFPEKHVTALATSGSRESSGLRFDRHEPSVGESVYIVEDVCNNFSTSMEMVKLIQSYGANVSGIVCFLNRSVKSPETFIVTNDKGLVISIPIISLVSKPFPQFTQDDPEVLEDIKKGNVVWKPKHDWSRLEEAMSRSA